MTERLLAKGCVLKHIENLNQRAITENDKTRFSL